MTQQTNALPAGTMLEEYQIESVLGTGGFGITYKAWDSNLESWVAVKEYFPTEWSYRDHDFLTVRANTQGLQSVADPNLSDYEWGLDRFLDEARVLARVRNPYVVRINRYFRANGSAYIVMDYEDGEPLSAVLRRATTLDEQTLSSMLGEILPALQAVHEQGYLHRDIKPGNLYVRADGSVILIDFGAARQSLGRQSKSVTGLVTPGYSPPEQYALRSDRYGTWTDIYALGAVLYRCISGNPPVESAERLIEDSLVPAMEVGTGRYSPQLLKVIDKALAVRPEHRYQSVEEMRADLGLLNAELPENSETPFTIPTTVPAVDEAETQFHAEPAPERAQPAATPGKQRLASLLAGVVLVVAVVALGWWWSTGGGTRDASTVGDGATPGSSNAEAGIANTATAIQGFWRFLAGYNQQLATEGFFWLEVVESGSVSDSTGEPTQSPEQEREHQIQQLLAQAAERLANNQLTIPVGNNALYFYEQVLSLDPRNQQALRGRSRIVDRYVALASQELNSADYAGARRLVRRGLNITPDHPQLLALAERLSRTPARRRSSVRINRPYPERRTVSPAELFNWDSR